MSQKPLRNEIVIPPVSLMWLGWMFRCSLIARVTCVGTPHARSAQRDDLLAQEREAHNAGGRWPQNCDGDGRSVDTSPVAAEVVLQDSAYASPIDRGGTRGQPWGEMGGGFGEASAKLGDRMRPLWGVVLFLDETEDCELT